MRNALLTLLLVLAGCGGEKKEPAKLYPLRGTVVSLDPKTNLATIKGEKVDGWMAAMTMEYPVESKQEYLALHKGENITATVNVTNDGYWLTNVKELKGD